jgi:cyclic-di-GMP-binding biofilm dispersal mediator protein
VFSTSSGEEDFSHEVHQASFASQTVEVEIRNSAVLVFGGTGGLGRAITAAAISRGASVVTSSRSVEGPGNEHLHVPGDITSAEDRERIVGAALEELGRLDVVIIASGVVGFGPVDMTRSDAMQSLVDIDLVGPLALCGLVAPMMTDGGTIGVITGAVADTTMLGTGVYTAAKAGLSAAVAVMARDWRRQGVRCIDIRPPHTETGLSDRPEFGTAPKLGAGLTPHAVAERIWAAFEGGESVLAPSDFAAAS